MVKINQATMLPRKWTTVGDGVPGYHSNKAEFLSVRCVGLSKITFRLEGFFETIYC